MTNPPHDPYTTPPTSDGAPPPPAQPYGGAPTPPAQPYGSAPPPPAQPYGGAPTPPAQPYGTPPAYGAQPTYGQVPQFGPPPTPGWSQSPTRPRSTRGAKILTVLGIVTLIAATIASAIGLSRVFGLVNDGVAGLEAHSSSVVTAVPGDTVTFEATEGAEFDLLAYSAAGVTSTVDLVVILDPAGNEVTLGEAGSTLSGVDGAFADLGRLSIVESGTYTLIATGPASEPAMETIALVPSAVLDDFLKDAVSGSMLFAGGILTGGLGFILTLVGGIWWGVAASHNRRLRATGAY